MRALLPLVVLGLVLVPAARAEAPALGTLAAELERLQAYAGATEPASVQERYDAARSLVEALARGEVPARCRPLARALGRAARAHVAAAEGIDRLDPVRRERGERALDAALGDLPAARRSCPATAQLLPMRATGGALLEPRDREAFFGRVEARVPAGARTVELRWRGVRLGPPRRVSPGRFRTALRGLAPGKGTLELRFRDGRGALVATRRAAAAWLLPASARAVSPVRRDPALGRRLAVAAQGFAGPSGVYVLDLARGRVAGWNEDARFPAASTVKLGVLAAALDRYGPSPERAGVLHDLRALAGWSSNLAANRLVRLLGRGDLDRGRAVVEARLRRLGASASTYPEPYRVGTSAGRRAAAPDPPPLVSTRTTTARDLARVLATLHLAATGAPGAIRRSGLGRHEARVALALLLGSEPAGDNAGLFRPALPNGLPAAQKHGWIATARHTAAVLYTARGPVVAVCLTYRAGLSLAEAQALGRRVLAAAGMAG